MLTKLQSFPLTFSLCIKNVWPDIYPDSWFILKFSQLAVKHSPNLRSFGLIRTLTSQPVLASIPLQEQDSFLPAAASSKPNLQCCYHLPILALPAASCPSPKQSPCARISLNQVKSIRDLQLWSLYCKLPVVRNKTQCQEQALTLDPTILWLWWFPKRLSSVLVYSEALELCMHFLKKERHFECAPLRRKSPLAIWALPCQFHIGFLERNSQWKRTFI